MNRLGNMRPCTGYCQMIGAAAALLSIKGIQVIFNSPRWCAVIETKRYSLWDRRIFISQYC